MRYKINSTNKFSMIQKICKDESSYCVYVNMIQMFSEKRCLDDFTKYVKESFSEKESELIINAIDSSNDFIMFDIKEDADKLFNIMRHPIFKNVYSVLVYPDEGLVDTN